jgi:hypothetical protein
MAKMGALSDIDRARPIVTPHLRKVIEKHGGPWGARALTAYTVGQALWPAYRKFKEWRAPREDDYYTIVVGGEDKIYPALHEWVLRQIPETDQKALILSTTRWKREQRESPFDENEPHPTHTRLRFDGSRVQDVEIEGHKVQVSVAKEESSASPFGPPPPEWGVRLEKIVFLAWSIEARDAIVRMVQTMAKEFYPNDEETLPALMMPSKFGGWQERMDIKPRSLDSVVLKDGQLENLVFDLQQFLDSEDDYEKFGQPWHRGYLFHGPPGTGKTSLAKALANHFGMAVHYLPLGDIDKDVNLLQLVSLIEGRTLLLIEDVDIYHAATERNEEDNEASLASLLNALDGIWTPHGLITVMTTNDVAALDPALVRPGRVDVVEELTVLDEDQARRLANFIELEADPASFVGEPPTSLIEKARQEQLDEARRKDAVPGIPERRPMQTRQTQSATYALVSDEL